MPTEYQYVTLLCAKVVYASIKRLKVTPAQRSVAQHSSVKIDIDVSLISMPHLYNRKEHSPLSRNWILFKGQLSTYLKNLSPRATSNANIFY